MILVAVIVLIMVVVLAIINSFDCMAFFESTTNDGLLPVTPAPGETHGYPITDDDVQMKAAGRILAMLGISAAIANFVQFRVGDDDTNPLKYSETQTFCKDQTSGHINPMQEHVPFQKNALMNCDFDHGANAQVASVIYLISTAAPLLWFDERPSDIPSEAVWVVATGVTAAVAGTWTQDFATYTYNWNPDKHYDCYGFRCVSPTGYAARIHPEDDPYEWRPGWQMGDSKRLAQSIYSNKPMMSWSGLTPPSFDKLCSSTDSTTTIYEMLVVERP